MLKSHLIRSISEMLPENIAMKFIHLFVLVFLLTPLECEAQSWILKLNQLEILKSSRADAERILDLQAPIRRQNLAETELLGWTELFEYESKYGDLELKFSTGGCSSRQNGAGYDVPAGLLVKAIFHLAKPTKVTAFRYDLSRFHRERVEDVHGAFEYEDFARGISLSVVKGKVTRIQFDLSKDHLELDCRKYTHLSANDR